MIIKNDIIKQHLKAINQDIEIKINTYYKSKKLSSNFTTRTKCSNYSHVVYQFSCPERDCKSCYIGYTTNTVNTRAQQHRFKPSKIHSHFENEHHTTKVGDIKNCFKTLYKSDSLCDLKIAEALLIKLYLPDINIRYNEMSNILSIF